MLLTQPAVAGSESLAELKPRIYYHMWDVGWGGGVDEMQNKTEFSKLGHGLGLGPT